MVSYISFSLSMSLRLVGGGLAICIAAAAQAENLASFRGEWVKTNAPARSDQPGIGSYIIFDPRDPTRLILSWAAPMRVALAEGQYGADMVWRNDVASCWYQASRVGSKLTLRSVKSEPPGICLEDSVFEMKQQASAVDPEAKRAVLPAQPPIYDPRREIVAFVELMTDYWIRGVLEPSLFAENLLYYGKPATRSHAVDETAKYFQRWFARRFIADTQSINYGQYGDGTFSVTWPYRFSGQRAGKSTVGSGQYMVRLRRTGSTFQIIEISDNYSPQQ